MDYITTKEASAKWGISPTRITILANEGRIPGAYRLGKSWLIPANVDKPQKRKPNRSGNTIKETADFSFPLYLFRPDWNYVKESQLSKQQQLLLSAETAVLECRFADAYEILQSVLQAPDSIFTEIGCLWTAGICCIGLNKPKDFSKICAQLQMLFTNDFPYRDDLKIIFKALKTYVVTINSIAESNTSYTDVHYQCLPLACILTGFTQLAREIINPGSADTALLELILSLLKTTGVVIAVEMIHCYLLDIYNLRQNTAAAEKHAKSLVKIAYENKYYFPLVTYYNYSNSVLAPILAQYPKDFQNHCLNLASQYDKNYAAFLSFISESSFFIQLTEAEQPYIYAVLTDLPNSIISEKLGVSQRTVKRRLEILYEKLGVKNKKALKEYLRSCL